MKTNLTNIILFLLAWLPLSLWAMPPTPVAEYSFDTITNNTLPDLSPNQNNGQIIGATQTTGRNGSGLQFDGNDYVEIAFSPSLSLSTQVSLEAWVFPTAYTVGWQAIISSENYAYYLYTNNGSQRSLGGVFTNDFIEALNNSALPLNTWSHIAMTYDGNSLLYYINGIQVANQTAQGNVISINGSLSIGGLNGTEGFIGNIDNVRIYNTALTVADIRQNMVTAAGTLPVPDTTAPTVAITNPSQTTTISGFNTLTAAASDNASIPSVEFFLDGVSIAAADTTPPYELFFNSSNQANRQYILTAVATDAAGLATSSTPITITIDNQTSATPIGAMSFTVNEANVGIEVLNYDYARQMQIPAGFGEAEFTFELWIKPDNSFPFGPTDGGDGQLTNWNSTPLNPQPDSNGGWWYRGNFLLDGHANNDDDSNDSRGTFSLQLYAGGKVRWHFYDSAAEWGIQAANADTSPGVVDGNWHHITLVRRWLGQTEAALEMWVDGALVAQQISTVRDNMRNYWDTWPNFGSNNEGWFWGVEKLTAIGSFERYEDYKGAIDEVRYWSRAKTSSEIANNYQDAVNGNEPNLVGLYQFSLGEPDQDCDVLNPSNCIDFVRPAPGFMVADNAPLGGVTTPPPSDTQDPVVGITSPVDTAEVSATIMLVANATDDVGVVGVQFRVNGIDFGAEDISVPYQINLDTTSLSNGNNTISAGARDANNNQGTSQIITVNVNNTQTPPPPGPVTVVDFDDPVLNSNPVGVFAGIDFGVGQWAVTGTYGSNNTNHIYFAADVASRTFFFANGARILTSLSIYSESALSQTLTLTDNNGQSALLVLSSNDGMQTVVTNWSLPATTITITFTDGWAFGLDDITYQ